MQLNITDNICVLSEYVNGLWPPLQGGIELGLPTSLSHAQNLAEASEHSARLGVDPQVEKIKKMLQQLDDKIEAVSTSAHPPTANRVQQVNDNSYTYQHGCGGRQHTVYQRGAHQQRGPNFIPQAPLREGNDCIICGNYVTLKSP